MRILIAILTMYALIFVGCAKTPKDLIDKIQFVELSDKNIHEKIYSHKDTLNHSVIVNECEESVKDRDNLIISLKSIYIDKKYPVRQQLINFIKLENDLVVLKSEFHSSLIKIDNEITNYLTSRPSYLHTGSIPIKNKALKSYKNINTEKMQLLGIYDKYVMAIKNLIAIEDTLAQNLSTIGINHSILYQQSLLQDSVMYLSYTNIIDSLPQNIPRFLVPKSKDDIERYIIGVWKVNEPYFGSQFGKQNLYLTFYSNNTFKWTTHKYVPRSKVNNHLREYLDLKKNSDPYDVWKGKWYVSNMDITEIPANLKDQFERNRGSDVIEITITNRTIAGDYRWYSFLDVNNYIRGTLNMENSMSMRVNIITTDLNNRLFKVNTNLVELTKIN